MNARALYEALLDTDGPYEDVIAPWLAQSSADDYRARLHTAATPRDHWWTDKEDGWNLLWELYALSRVSDYLLLDPKLPPYLHLFTALGMTPFDTQSPFDPFLHEITEVEQVDDPNAPIEILDVRWPGLMLGELLFNRAGVRVRAGAAHAERGVADRWPIYWTHRRAHRPTRDLSQGWGNNSQWRTDFRLDYRTADGDLLNIAEDAPIDGRPDLDPNDYGNLGPDERLLTPTERRELLRHRTFLRAPAASSDPAWAADLFPFEWRLPADEVVGSLGER
ncbi:hypothetical protein [Kitasatospora cathayae]|uniref:DUF4240 domain-containing protein n=1 Tax=Kitasatospora cathayae TaxID=3004092 RepID=A0ABY7Q9Z7_9ACTN|nr:hypothetical protein [Kitasatospora sp. HUAS 3-15]WBP89582.1 hypothetical protein O1G21_29565 [Kitasatospora sp. HUAS 3-15]